jgi:hypothetical protein
MTHSKQWTVIQNSKPYNINKNYSQNKITSVKFKYCQKDHACRADNRQLFVQHATLGAPGAL